MNIEARKMKRKNIMQNGQSYEAIISLYIDLFIYLLFLFIYLFIHLYNITGNDLYIYIYVCNGILL